MLPSSTDPGLICVGLCGNCKDARWQSAGMSPSGVASIMAWHLLSLIFRPAGPWGMFSSEPMPPQMRMPTGMMPRPPMIGPGSWMPQAALDTSQDGLKRPPAA